MGVLPQVATAMPMTSPATDSAELNWIGCLDDLICETRPTDLSLAGDERPVVGTEALTCGVRA